MGIEELGLGLSSICPLTVPPATAVTVEGGIAFALDGDVGAGDTDEGAIPLIVAKGSLALEDDSGTIAKVLIT